MNILIVSRINDLRVEEYATRLRAHLIHLGHTLYKETQDISHKRTLLFRPESPPDLVIVIGGDGTILLTVQKMPVQVPIVGVNWGEVGFLADLEAEDAFNFFSSLTLPVPAEPRMRISLSIDGNVIGTALNDALVVTDRPAKMLKFLIHIDGVIAERFRADGLLISTPTGSTAYAMSAGGPIVDPKVDGFLMVPLAPFMLSNRPHLIACSRTLTITLEAEKPAKLVIDGQIDHHIGVFTTIEVRRHQESALFVEAGQNFFEKINRKLRHL
ncbi:MAG TPA: NAD(+)/NADH kinase [Methanospirillum sp.]|nr:NAD(+)/NADH kinase [Methanospirillum sp.]